MFKVSLHSFLLLTLTSLFFTATGAPPPLVVADFNSGKKPSNIGQEWGSWNYDPKDPEQRCEDTLAAEDYQKAEAGYSVRIDYDVQSRKPAFNGFWMKLGGLDASPYQWFSFWVKGNPRGKFTRRFKVELKNEFGKSAIYVVDNLKPQWQEIRIPFKKNTSFKDWSKLSEFVIVFDDILSTYKEGTLYLDQIEFQP